MGWNFLLIGKSITRINRLSPMKRNLISMLGKRGVRRLACRDTSVFVVSIGKNRTPFLERPKKGEEERE